MNPVSARSAALALALAGLAAMTAGTRADAASGTVHVAFREVFAGTRGFNLPGERQGSHGRVLRTRTQAVRLLRSWGADFRAAKRVDFSRESLIVMLAAYQPTGGYRARVSQVGVQRREATLTASVRYEGGDFATQSLERPWVVVAVRRRALANVRDQVRIRLRR